MNQISCVSPMIELLPWNIVAGAPSIVTWVGWKLFRENGGGLQLFDPRGVFVELHLYDVVEVAID
jgi:hypothetical protein